MTSPAAFGPTITLPANTGASVPLRQIDHNRLADDTAVGLRHSANSPFHTSVTSNVTWTGSADDITSFAFGPTSLVTLPANTGASVPGPPQP